MPGLAFKTIGGEGEDIVLIHGFGSDRLSWLATSPALMAVGKVHALDLPGHGESPVEVGDGSPRQLAAWVSQELVAQGITRAHLVGHSLGGGLTLLMAANQPERVASLSLIAPAGLGAGIDKSFLAAYSELSDPEAATALLRRLVAVPLLINKMTVKRVLDQLGRDGIRQALATIAMQLVRNESGLGDAAAIVATQAIPRLVVWGARDTINPFDADRLAEFGAAVQMIANAAHLPHIENPKPVNEALVDFLKRSMAS